MNPCLNGFGKVDSVKLLFCSPLAVEGTQIDGRSQTVLLAKIQVTRVGDRYLVGRDWL